ncbi:MAG: ATP-binding protein [Candidatus Nealsonbacteria bacterium DGGOD1a]|nr:MAG: ATP-binding protein [Candidatus Nealsonbacteria bacterium DGGOD1a]
MIYPRKIYQELKEHLAKKEITVLTGMRRTGKTTLVKQLLKEIDSENKIYFDLQILANQDVFSPRNFEAIVESLKRRGLDFSRKTYVFLDEIQLVKEIPGILKYLYDNYDIKFVVTGSSSYYLKNLFTESLSGRKKIFEIFPLDFGEFLVFKNIKTAPGGDWQNKKFDSAEYNWLKASYEEFVEYGGFPQAVLAQSSDEKKDLLNEILSSYANIDVAALADFADRRNVANLIKMLAGRVGTRLDYAKLSRLSGLARPVIKNYLDLFEGTYLISRIPVFTNNKDREIVKAEKLYFCDSGMLGILADVGGGAKFENAVFAQLRARGEVRYYALKNGREIDFIFDEKYGLEVKETPIESDENNLAEVAKTAGVKNYRLIGKNLSPAFDNYIWAGTIR